MISYNYFLFMVVVRIARSSVKPRDYEMPRDAVKPHDFKQPKHSNPGSYEFVLKNDVPG